MLKISKITISSFYKNIFIMFKGTLIAQVIALVASVVLAKLYGTEALGVFGVFISFSAIISIINTLQLDTCIVTSKTESDSRNWKTFLFFLSPMLTAVILLFVTLFLNYFPSEKISILTLLLSAFGGVLLSYTKIHEAYLTFTKSFKTISTGKIILVIINVSFQYLLFFNYKIFGIIYGFTLSLLSVCFYYYFKTKKPFKFFNFQKITLSFNQNTSIVAYLLPSNIINGLALHLMPVLIFFFFSTQEAGVYFFSLKIVAAPLFLISSSVSQVFFQKSSELYKENKTLLYGISKKLVRINTLVMLAFIVFINTIGIYFLDLYFDENWESLRLFIFLLSFLILARASFNPISSLIVVLDKNHIGLLFNSYLFAVNLIAIYIGYLYHNITYTVLFLAIFGGTGYLMLLAYFLRILKKLQDVS